MPGTVIQAGNGGRGFVIDKTETWRYVVTAAHCLGKLPPAHGVSYLQEHTYRDFIGALGGARN